MINMHFLYCKIQKTKALIAFFGSLWVLTAVHADSSLFHPEQISVLQAKRDAKDKSLEMRWIVSETGHFRFISSAKELYYEIILDSLPETFSKELKEKFLGKNDPENVYYKGHFFSSYTLKNNGDEVRNMQKIAKEKFSLSEIGKQKSTSGEGSYTVCDRRVFTKSIPNKMETSKLIELLKTKKVLIYTGAGISAASDIPMMQGLNELLGFEEGINFFPSLEKAVGNSRAFAKKIMQFHNACLFSSPTKAHVSLKEIADHIKTKIITENLDCLHEYTGAKPLRIVPKDFEIVENKKLLSKADYVLCVGLSYDDKGFLGLYKLMNPSGKIISIDKSLPSYLGNEDFLLSGDLQKIIPDVAKCMMEDDSTRQLVNEDKKSSCDSVAS